MKQLILFAAFALACTGVFAQDAAPQEKSPAQLATEKMAQQYNLTESQTVEMLKVQERKFRNLAEIELLKKSNPPLYLQKVRAIQYGNDASIRRLLDMEQAKIFQQQQHDLRVKKAEAYKEMKAAGATQQAIDEKMAELDLESLQ